MRKYKEYKEVRLPEEIMQKLEKGAEAGKPVTLGEAGTFEWLNQMSAKEGWQMVWSAFNFPFFVLEREVEKAD